MIDDVEAEEYTFISHAIYQQLGYQPPIMHPKLTRFIGVSQYSCDKLEEFARSIGLNIKAELFYNPLKLEPKEKVLRLVAASRLKDGTKGGNRIFTLIDALDRYCERTGRHYIFDIFSDSDVEINSINVAKRKPRVDVRPFIADSDILVQLSNDMETYCYSINEALGYHTKICTTPLTILEELKVPKEARYTCNWDMSNVDEVVKEMFERKDKEWTYEPPKSDYRKILYITPNKYEEEKKMKYLVEALDTYQKYNIKDADLNYIPAPGERWEVSAERKDVLLGDNKYKYIFVKVVEQEKKEEKKVVDVVEDKPIKTKTTRKKATAKK